MKHVLSSFEEQLIFFLIFPPSPILIWAPCSYSVFLNEVHGMRAVGIMRRSEDKDISGASALEIVVVWTHFHMYNYIRNIGLREALQPSYVNGKYCSNCAAVLRSDPASMPWVYQDLGPDQRLVIQWRFFKSPLTHSPTQLLSNSPWGPCGGSFTALTWYRT